jgi:hypothetical protein
MGIGLSGASGAPLLNASRAEASRKNGAKSRGPKTPEGKARSSQNALKHGLRARKWVVLAGESETEFKRLEAALIEELAPEGVLQSLLAQRVAAAAWRLGRAEQVETQLFAENSHGAGRSLGLALIRDCNGARSFATLLRYRGGTLAELWRSLRTLKALQAEAAQAPRREAAGAEPAALPETPSKPEARRNPGASPGATGPVPPPARAAAIAPAAVAPAPAVPSRLAAPTRTSQPDEPRSPRTPYDLGRDSDRTDPVAGRGQPLAWLPSVLPTPAESALSASPLESAQAAPAASAPCSSQSAASNRSASLPAGTALASARQSACRRLD